MWVEILAGYPQVLAGWGAERNAWPQSRPVERRSLRLSTYRYNRRFRKADSELRNRQLAPLAGYFFNRLGRHALSRLLCYGRAAVGRAT